MIELLLNTDAFACESFVTRLLEGTVYQNVEVTTCSCDGGVEVIAEIEPEITSLREGIQVECYKRSMRRKDWDSLRGSLSLFDAVRGPNIGTSRLSKGAEEVVFAGEAGPITVIEGDERIDLLIEHSNAVRKRSLELLTVYPDTLADLKGAA